MHQENVEIVRRLIEVNRSDDLDAAIDLTVSLADEDWEYASVMAAVEPGVYRGHEGVRRYFDDLLATWAEWESQAEDVSEVGPDTVLATIRFRATGKQSGVAVEARLGAIIVLSEGKVLRAHTYPSREQALEAMGPEG